MKVQLYAACALLILGFLIQTLSALHYQSQCQDLQWAMHRDWLQQFTEAGGWSRHSGLGRAISRLGENPSDAYALDYIHQQRLADHTNIQP